MEASVADATVAPVRAFIARINALLRRPGGVLGITLEAGNMRLFEATGVGTFLLTDFKDNLHLLFAPDRDVATWRSIEDCLQAIERYLRDDSARTKIAHAGQAKTMAQHTYRHRTAEILGFVEGIRAQR